MPKKVDPLNKKIYGAVTAMLTVTDVKAAVAFYQKAFGFAKRGIMNGPDGKPIHAELTLRGTTLMLSPEMPQMGARSAKTIGASPTSLYLLTENADKTVAKAVKLGASLKGEVMDMFWGDRSGTVVDPEGYTWMVATHISQPTPKEMQKKMKEQMVSQQAARAASGS
ncbi:MAG: VOC family protein [Candidatus Acidiferrales bacterium]|jgi:PhnB protein